MSTNATAGYLIDIFV